MSPTLQVTLRFYEELNVHLPAERRKITYTAITQMGATVGELIRAEGVPLQEVDLVLVNGVSVDFNQQVDSGNRIAVYPVFESFDVSSITRLPDRPLRRLRFAVDGRLAALAEGLRRRGYDVAIARGEEALLCLAGEGRVVLTPMAALVRDRALERAHVVRSQTPREQLREVLCCFDLPRVVDGARSYLSA